MKTTIVTGLAIALAAASLTAQKDSAAGYGRHFIPTFNNETGANNLMLGVQELGGKLYCTGRGNGAITVAPHTVIIRDFAGKMTGSFSQGTNSTGAWGYRDGATDGKSLMFGWEGGINVMDTAGTLVTSVVAKLGAQVIVNPIKSKGITTTHRGMCYDPEGNGGKGSILVGNFASNLEEIALDGTLLRTLATTLNTGADVWSVYGLALDTSGATKTFWANAAPNAGDLVEYKWSDGKATGNRIATSGGTQGGLCGYTGKDAKGEDVHFGLIAMVQAVPDSITGHRVDVYKGLDGESEAELMSNARSGALSVDSPKEVFPGNKLGFGWGAGTTGVALYLLDAGAPAPANISLGNLLPELRRPGLVQFVAPRSTTAIEGTLGATTPIGLELILQALSIEPKATGVISGIIASNQVAWKVAKPFKALVSADGANSFNSATASGYFQIANQFALPITEVTFDWTGVTTQATMVFRHGPIRHG